LNEIGNYQLLEGDVGKVLRALVEKKDFEAPDIVVVDPPRGGLDSLAIAQIRLLHPKILLYISCNPATQMENIKYLQKDYRLLQMQPIDQFPHTPHIENIALLERI
jgi:23S rRNA (uracil1939-C5)-methyltransferase